MNVSCDSITLHRAAKLLGCALDSPPVHYLMGLAPSSRATQAVALRHAAKAFGVAPASVAWQSIDLAQMSALRAWVAERYAPSTANRILTSVRAVMTICARTGLMTRDALDNCKVKPIRGKREPAGRSLGAPELAQLFAAARSAPEPLGARHAAMLGLAYGGGMRRSELVRVELDGWDDPAGTVRVVGKGNVERTIPLPEGAAAAVRAWIARRGWASGPLLCALRGPHRDVVDVTSPLHATTVYEMMRVLRRRAKIAHFSPHDLRRTYIGDLLDAGVDLATAQALAGHRDPVTTSGYDRRGARARAAAAARINVPFV